MTEAPKPAIAIARRAFRRGEWSSGTRTVAEETAIAFTFDRATYAVMMATPADLEDFAVGFSLCEQIIAAPAEISSIDVVPRELGIELQMSLVESRAERLTARRRFMTGAVGCGLCGIESLKEAMRPLPAVTGGLQIDAGMVSEALSRAAQAQAVNQSTRAVHFAAFWHPAKGLVALREDVGRHNALDKLAGALANAGLSPRDGIVVISSRVSVEMVQKCAVIGAPIVAAISAPTALAIRTAAQAGITLIAVARDDGFEVFTGEERMKVEARDHVA